VKETAASWVAHKDARLGAALAYYSIFSVGPLIVIVISVAGVLFGEDAVRGEVSAQVQGLLGNSGAQAIQSMLVGASRPRGGTFAAVFGIVTLIFAALGVVVQLKDALNTVWEVQPKRAVFGPSLAPIWSHWREFFLSASFCWCRSLAARSWPLAASTSPPICPKYHCN